eukprot:CAMPEP_0203926734 /NCGR_PEP_ID=MMETSP0359-20131031/66230_1 /ASSEMBLY_ACC=CAM_ASM_000338 /TAXON_ID=268821 /ORGANISM="Scrippsiella Hangoei, Strain SHTV-5" /LENGTH=242 /DNA_ID=CAMNT_0050855385 /DNA_START=376 /DNA_END=1100 /DNA_ORIENTATION=+
MGRRVPKQSKPFSLPQPSEVPRQNAIGDVEVVVCERRDGKVADKGAVRARSDEVALPVDIGPHREVVGRQPVGNQVLRKGIGSGGGVGEGDANTVQLVAGCVQVEPKHELPGPPVVQNLRTLDDQRTCVSGNLDLPLLEDPALKLPGAGQGRRTVAIDAAVLWLLALRGLTNPIPALVKRTLNHSCAMSLNPISVCVLPVCALGIETGSDARRGRRPNHPGEGRVRVGEGGRHVAAIPSKRS